MAKGDGNTGQIVPGYQGAYSSDIGELQKRFRQAEQVRERFTADWFLNSAFYIGQQWLYWNRGRLDAPRLAPWRATVVDNRILPVCWARASRKVKNKPTFLCTPHTGDESDYEAAAISEKVLEADWYTLELTRKLFRALMATEIVGAGFWKITWDSSQGEKADFVFQPDGTPMTQPDGRPVKAETMANMGMAEGYNVRPVAAGDVSIEVNSAFEMYPDPLAGSFEEVEWLIEKKVRSVNYVREKFDFDPMPDTAAPLGPVESRLFASTTYAGSEADYQGVAVYEYWCQPNQEHPKGKRCVWANDQVLVEEEPFDPMPYVMFSGLQVPERFWPTSMTTQLRGPQVELNKVRSSIQENAMRIGNPALLTSRQANIRYSGLPGERVEYDSTVPDAVPSYLQPPEVPTYVREEIERIVDSITEISGLHEVSKAQVPTGVTAASAINLLMEADDTRIGPEIQDMERALEQAGTKILRLRAQFNTDERMVKLAGEDGNWDIFAFRGAMLKDSTDVEVQAGSAMPRSKAAKQAAMTELLGLALQYGLPIDPRSLRKFFKDYEVGSLDRLFENITHDERQIERENRQMAHQGMPLPINDWDNDQAHIEGHDTFRKSATFERLPEQIKALFLNHINQHRQRAVAQVNLQLEQQAQEEQQRQLQEGAAEMVKSEQAHQQEQESKDDGEKS